MKYKPWSSLVLPQKYENNSRIVLVVNTNKKIFSYTEKNLPTEAKKISNMFLRHCFSENDGEG